MRVVVGRKEGRRITRHSSLFTEPGEHSPVPLVIRISRFRFCFKMKVLTWSIVVIILVVYKTVSSQSPALDDVDVEDGAAGAAAPGINIMDMKVSELLQALKVDPSILGKAAADGETTVLEKFKNYVQGKLLGIISVPCYADLGYFAQQLFEYGAAVYQLSNACSNSTTGLNCDCATRMEREVDAKAWTMSGAALRVSWRAII